MARARARILRVEDMGLPITIVSERLVLPRGSPGRRFLSNSVHRCTTRLRVQPVRAPHTFVNIWFYTHVREICVCMYMYIYICICMSAERYAREPTPHRRFYFPSATPQLGVSQPQNVSSPSLCSVRVKLDFIGLLSILCALPRKILPAEAITAGRCLSWFLPARPKFVSALGATPSSPSVRKTRSHRTVSCRFVGAERILLFFHTLSCTIDIITR